MISLCSRTVTGIVPANTAVNQLCSPYSVRLTHFKTVLLPVSHTAAKKDKILNSICRRECENAPVAALQGVNEVRICALDGLKMSFNTSPTFVARLAEKFVT